MSRCVCRTNVIMERFKRILKIAGIVILVSLASLGIGITGAAPIDINRKDSKPENGTKIELVEEQTKRLKGSKHKEIK